jgi:hypothetical protein
MARIEAEVGKPQGGFMQWIDDRFPWTATMKYHVTEYYASKNFNFWYVGRGTRARLDLQLSRRPPLAPDAPVAIGRRCAVVGLRQTPLRTPLRQRHGRTGT